MQFDSFTVIVLRRGANAERMSDADLDILQAAHEGHLGTLVADGKLLTAGPFVDQSDDSFRGICFSACPLAEAVELISADPSVRAGRLAFDAMTWLAPAGTVNFPAAP
jgi:uncharacterized protein